jgi:hypothetical protein
MLTHPLASPPITHVRPFKYLDLGGISAQDIVSATIRSGGDEAASAELSFSCNP